MTVSPSPSVIDKEKNPISPESLEFLQCPQSGESIILKNGKLQSHLSAITYDIIEKEIPLFAENFISEDAKIQEIHYNKVAKNYIENLNYPHTQEYTKYLDDAFLKIIGDEKIDIALEICCGKGEAFKLLKNRVTKGFGIDISINMLKEAKKNKFSDQLIFLQGDATRLPLKKETVSHVFILGGIHHVNNREKLFAEIYRVLKNGGKFYWREPVSDFFLWKWIRAIIYRFSPHLDHTTEQPLQYHKTIPLLEKAGFKFSHWETLGLLGFCFFMNSDILVFNRLFRFIPGIRNITRLFVKIDKIMSKISFFKNAGLQVIGFVEKPINTEVDR